MDKERLYDQLKNLLGNNPDGDMILSFGTGLHGTTLENAKSILEQGLNYRPACRSILGTVKSIDDLSDEKCKDTFLSKTYKDFPVNVIIACPKYLYHSDDKFLYLGFPPLELRDAGNQYTQTCVLDFVLSRHGHKIPKEFILGYYTIDSNDPYITKFVKNPNHYLSISQSERDRLFEQMSALLDDSTEELVSKSVVEGDYERLEYLRSVGLKDLKKTVETALADLNKRVDIKNRKK